MADRPWGFIPKDAIGYKSLVALDEIIADSKGVGKQSKLVEKEYMDIIYNCGPEFNILTKLSLKELFSKLPEKVAEGIKRVRDKNLDLIPGYDGEYGVIKIFNKDQKKEKGPEQLSLF